MIELREYQTTFLNNVIRGLSDHRGVLAVAPTGSGKTVVFNSAIERFLKATGEKVLVLAHRTELISQASMRLWQDHRLPCAVIQGKQPVRHDMLVFVASVQTLKNRKMPKDIGLVITDEAHHAKAETYQMIYEQLPEARMLGFTATPWRLSGAGFQDTFPTMVEGPSIRWLEKAGYLCQAKQFIVPMDHKAFQAAVTVTSTGDYHQRKLGDFMSTDPMIRAAVSSWLEYGEDKQTIAFMSSIEQSLAMVKELRARGVSAVHVDGSTKKDARRQYFSGLAGGTYRVLCNVGIATEGLDVPSVQCVLLGRPTKSLSLYLQMCGRGSRTAPNKPGHYNLIDIGDNILEHGHPNKKQNWNLEGWDKRSYQERRQFFRVLLPSGQLLDNVPRHKIPRVPGIKVLETPPPIRIDEINRIYREVQNAGHKRAKVYYDFLRACGNYPPSLEELRYLAKVLGYSAEWVHYKSLALGITAAAPQTTTT